MNWLHGISITCFAASYAVAFGFEISRVFSRKNFQRYVATIFAAAGLFAHSVYLTLQTQFNLDTTGIWSGSWSGWCLTGAWVLAAAYLWYSVRKSETVVGIFIIPLVMLLIGVGTSVQTADAFSDSQARSMWSMLHGSALLFGTVIVSLGFAFGLMYLYQAYRLKRKMFSPDFRLPSLEWLQVAMERALWVSALMLGLGLISGIVINSINNESKAADYVLPWSDPVVWTSGVLFAWLLSVTVFNFVYQPSRQGRKVAYLVVASFLFLVLELGIVWFSGHAVSNQETAALTAVVESMEASK